jgi:hypothetical protein
MSTEKLVKAPEQRTKRNPVEGRNKLAVKGKDPNFDYRVVNDTEDRINELLDRGWVIETDESIRIGDRRVDETTAVGKVRQIPVGQGTRAVLMKIRKDWKAEDEAEKQKYVDKTEAAMRPSSDGQFGTISLTRK